MAETVKAALRRLIELTDPDADAEKAAEILTAGDSGARVFELTSEDIMGRTGLNRRAAEAIDLVDELKRYAGVEKAGPRPLLTDAACAEAYFSALFWGRHVEHCTLSCLDKSGRLIRTVLLSRGDVQSGVVNPRDILRAALTTDAAYAILAHNHPGGSLFPSPEDRELTQTARKLLQSVGTELIEHYIVTARGCAGIGKDET